ncbi:PIN domain-containing protein [Acuticoccus mangrovi]|uniref:PIN domain-containing protein n=1 Tax=Acuticoccus mangrovi TaxID=2796142 RepID=A0A934MJZ3_9HYPH|nr:PIN domain-containing protein [Acuticoccus mangrovi]MBJ3778811.1 hypothetical protein [Acuticoccus mangrovi]
MDYSKYSKVVFLDANVVLEGRKLGDQPWREIVASGKILLLFVPQVLKEIDNKKRDGRLAKHARDFNRLIAPAAETGDVVRLVNGSPLVDLSLAVTNRIDWDKLYDLDPEEPDARVIAQVLNEKYTNFDDRLFVSQDINPIGMATRHDLNVKRLPESWLRAAEPSPDQRKINKLEEKVRKLQATEPDLQVLVQFLSEEPFKHIVSSDLTQEQKHELKDSIIAKNPIILQRQKSAFDYTFTPDPDYKKKYQIWQNLAIPHFVESLINDINRMYAQMPIALELRNDGAVQAENLVIHVNIVNGTISDRWNIVPRYPAAPKPVVDRFFDVFDKYNLGNVIPQNIGRHEMHFDKNADGGDSFVVNCQDFRHGRSWVFNAILTADPTTTDDVVLIVDVTASNMRGNKQKVFKLSHVIDPKELSSIYNIRSLEFIANRPMEEELKQWIKDRNFSQFNFFKYDDED